MGKTRPTLEFLTLGNKKIETCWHNTGQKGLPTLIFLHEGLGCVKMWKNFPLAVSRATRCPALVFSRYGYGSSDPDPLPWKINFMHHQALKILPDIIQAAQIRDYILIGHSDGGSIGIVFAGSPLARGLKGLVTEAAHVFCEPVTVACIRQAKIQYDRHHLKQGLEKYHGKNTENAFRGWNDVWLNPNFIHWNIEKYLGRIKVPLLAIQGKDDQYGTIKQIESIRHHAPHAQTCLMDDCRHAPHNEQPEKTLDLIARFVHRTIEGKA